MFQVLPAVHCRSNDSDSSDDLDSSSESESSDSSSVVSSSSWKKVKVDWAPLPVFDPKEGFEDWERQWGDFMKEELQRSRFGSSIEEKVKEFPYDTNRYSAAGEVVKPKIKFGFTTLRRRLSNLEVEAMGVQRPIKDAAKPTMILHALDPDQKNTLITAIRAQKGEMLLDLNSLL
uniref:Uncharacterized protein n=1 Tax=Chromera velia CCMP2878 TaxID=1169474 RepID=A0A0G4GW64_9ALVE|eukprot:Cvel_23654.t1-p1 / transcript=Cvel_23654.t1 / gene=Cvel_23654 / organism=Chromera_velia_CCMP2878 / gene_product=hypothetical protein / transcript_product=hypothetical protein / location=Cvel_scaffold2462:18051-22401(+) / protein_length=174 / sequence_SO=supercontig / SO=protein_coding / is_pseudo=false